MGGGCPFAALAGYASASTSSSASPTTFQLRHQHASTRAATFAPAPSSTLTGKMKDATWAVHRRLERSAGVAALMGRSTGSADDYASPPLEHIAYLRFLIMLVCIYAPMEEMLVVDAASPPLHDIVRRRLVRTGALLLDVQAHLDQLACQRGATIADLCLDDDADVDQRIHSLNCYEALTTIIVQAQNALQQHDALFTSVQQITPSLVTSEYVALLTPRQAHAVHTYVQHMRSWSASAHYDEGISFTPVRAGSPSEKDDSHSLSGAIVAQPSPHAVNDVALAHPIVAHAYVRYMGDLSGGQHMARRLRKLFSVDDNDTDDSQCPQRGFAFYTFDGPATETKEVLRCAIDSIVTDQAGCECLINEAIGAFDLHHALFDSLVSGAEYDVVAVDDDHAPWTPVGLPGSFPIAPSAVIATAAASFATAVAVASA